MKHINEICELLSKKFPNPKSELIAPNDWCFAVAVILSAQTTDKRVNMETPALFKIAKSPADFVKLGVDGLIPYIKSIGLYKNKANNIIKLAQIIEEKYGGQLPKDKEILMELPGIGAKTAGVIMNDLWGGKNIPVDTHVFRVSHRLGLVKESANTPEKAGIELEKIVPEQYKNNFSNYLVLLGRYTCIARKPKCDECQLTQYCPWYRKNVK
ncbi:MAG: endonuclease III [Rickettsiales bacterium]|jgi:endonuclease-3|nr:endonuclease III [Rickettsiales bacterium]